MKQKLFHYILLILGVLLLTACMPKYDPNKEYSFKADEQDTIFSNPPQDKTRIYFYRKKAFFGWIVRYYISAHHGDFDVNNPFAKDYEFAFFSKPGFAYYIDIEAKDSITLYAKTEKGYTFSFIPKKDSIYCFEASVSSGFFVGRPYFVFVDMPTCQKQIAKLMKKDSKNLWEKYKEDFYKKREKSK